MKAYKIELLVVDLDNMGLEETIAALENTRYVTPLVLSSQEAEIGKWHDDHPLNKEETFRQEADRLFKS